jgi:transposase-like protein
MKVISQATKEAIVKKVLSNPDAKLKAIAIRNNIGYSTLSKWLKVYRAGQFNQPDRRKNAKQSLSSGCNPRDASKDGFLTWNNKLFTRTVRS